ncbi:HIT family protein [Sphingomonas sp.]|uniref:HIT family protein n=1 Tax=Sphingomonas sp. TaxID=28214 RepID=UPI00286D8A41|nr:HIT family protein [Sphingomonas sp.]
MANATMEKFGFPATLVHQFEHWAVLVRPAQVTLGSLVLVATGEAVAYGDLPAEAFTEQGRAVKAIERALAEFTRYERINYLMLMMVDPHVHFHVIPRYPEPREWNGKSFADAGWPGQPALGSAVTLEPADIESLAKALKSAIAGNLD